MDWKNEWKNLKLEIDAEGIALLTIDNEATLNALDSAALRDLEELLDGLIKRSPVPRALIVTGAGKAFARP